MASEEMLFENADDDERMADACLYYKLTCRWAFGSGTSFIKQISSYELRKSNVR